MFLRVVLSENCILRSRRPTVLALTSIPTVSSSSAIGEVDESAPDPLPIDPPTAQQLEQRLPRLQAKALGSFSVPIIDRLRLSAYENESPRRAVG